MFLIKTFILLYTTILVACVTIPDLTGVTSYYVHANGNDKNNGTSEEKPFKTLARAIEASIKTNVKRITVIGTLKGPMLIEDMKNISPASVRALQKYMDSSNAKDIARKIGIVVIQGSWDVPVLGEILITGKQDASPSERAVLTSNTETPLLILNRAIRLEHIEISTVHQDCAVRVINGDLILGKGTKITNNSMGININGGTLIMWDDAEISHNAGTGVYFQNGSMGILLGNALVTYNKAATDGGGIVLQGSRLDMRDNATISNNIAGNAGGGIMAITDEENGYFSQISMYDDSAVIDNCAVEGGGIFFQDILSLLDTARVTGNIASVRGGGVLGTSTARITKRTSVILENNGAPQFPDINFDFN